VLGEQLFERLGERFDIAELSTDDDTSASGTRATCRSWGDPLDVTRAAATCEAPIFKPTSPFFAAAPFAAAPLPTLPDRTPFCFFSRGCFCSFVSFGARSSFGFESLSSRFQSGGFFSVGTTASVSVSVATVGSFDPRESDSSFFQNGAAFSFGSFVFLAFGSLTFAGFGSFDPRENESSFFQNGARADDAAGGGSSSGSGSGST